MKTLKSYLMASLVLGFSAASAYADDASYCAALSKSYREFIGTGQTNMDAAEAMSQCSKGNTAAGIPVLEKVLRDAKISLPAR